jgi:hypothetical protein
MNQLLYNNRYFNKMNKAKHNHNTDDFETLNIPSAFVHIRYTIRHAYTYYTSFHLLLAISLTHKKLMFLYVYNVKVVN